MNEILFALWFASIQYGVSYELLYAIAKVESGLNPYAININGKGYYPESKEFALRLIENAENYDAGLMQINSFWIEKYDLEREKLFDPYYNAMWGAYILRYCQSIFGNTWKAVECYHRGEMRANRISNYSRRVCSIIYGKELCFTF